MPGSVRDDDQMPLSTSRALLALGAGLVVAVVTSPVGVSGAVFLLLVRLEVLRVQESGGDAHEPPHRVDRGRHCGTGTNPGSTQRRPSEKLRNSASERLLYGTAPILL
jgi:hypothetical protein